MPYKLGISNKKDYIYISASGRQTLDNNIKLAQECIEACKKHRIFRVIIDITGASGQPGTFADYELAKLLHAWETAKTITKAALVENKSELNSGRFFETAVRNRGLNLISFSDIADAEAWIKI